VRPTLRGLTAAVALGLLVAVGGDAAERVDVTAMDGVQLIAELSGASGPGVVLVADADQARGKTVADAIAARGFRVLRLDLRGHGASAGPADHAAADRDIEGAYRYLLGRKVRPVFLLATERTAAAARAVAARVPAAGVRVVGPDEDVESVLRWLRDPQAAP
jgi:pimeloyl-ACP methyl ester carboxylesterase